jgi:hypothetical protein
MIAREPDHLLINRDVSRLIFKRELLKSLSTA